MAQAFNWSDMLRPISPWAHVVLGSEPEMDNQVFALQTSSEEHDTVVRIIRCSRCSTMAENYTYWAAALQFPWYFGYGGAAFEDCMHDLSWLKAKRYVIIMTNFDDLLSGELEAEETLIWFVEVLARASAYWKTPVHYPGTKDDLRLYEHDETPFHVIFHSLTETGEKAMRILSKATSEFDIFTLGIQGVL